MTLRKRENILSEMLTKYGKYLSKRRKFSRQIEVHNFPCSNNF